ncbi:hypothetical protein H4R33_004853 [Dimargaris cristalligena]|uniref:Roadblock/LAMTOR2 domain-containing protein n=1 Tax=Dimargaris cristalligena TaxID=215637 RepID=A0A4P9ZUQ3_9FUNG|nr:hypothetical protein H4R33_004853 [Dimargaris cristalligena]RKP37304.1 hypothetical protein BJ085DRAFT_29816 [Dimargaris cristalligena]|eukprot:RKP37304.1 hypothetical protein BJ085DRAFT_29816 [Dimargaris cristalligena]
MLQQNTLVKVLNQALSGGVDTVVLFNRKGEVHTSVSNHPDSIQHGAIVSTILSQSCNILVDEFHQNALKENLQYSILIFEEGKVGIALAGRGVIGLMASMDTPTGNLRLKLKSLQKHLQEPLDTVDPELF